MLGTRMLNLLDNTTGSPGLPIGALLISPFFDWRLPATALREEFNAAAEGRELCSCRCSGM